MTLLNYHEQLILAEDWDTNEIYALGTISIAKHSNTFWTNYNSSILPNFSVKKKVNSIHKPSGRSKAIVGADCAGYVIGGVTGVTVGSVTLGPAGGVGGFIAGKIGGAVMGSNAMASAFAIYDAWSDYF